MMTVLASPIEMIAVSMGWFDKVALNSSIAALTGLIANKYFSQVCCTE